MSFLLSLLGIGRIIRAWVGAVIGWVMQSATHILIAACIALAAWGWIGWHGKAKAEKVLASTEAAYRSTQADAKAKQEALNSSISDRYSAIAKESHDDYPQALDDAHSAVVRYAGLHACPASSSGASKPAAVSSDSVAPASPGGTSAMVSVAVADLDKLARNTVRAESCRAWGQSLIDSGIAVPGD